MSGELTDVERDALATLITIRAEHDERRLSEADVDVEALLLPSHTINGEILRVDGDPRVIVDVLWRAMSGRALA